ncbi:sigma factor-like helix-turn-helix DNA-binding protein [Bacillus cereus group sp. Bc015]|uniref:sigma factor-like helix-turn-helix DNA-binding protein n=1 Tax=Bacillus cereus group sp. Bc015 TaxID=3018123 RepID=UPI0022E81C2B|nr:sigma factor-like helix-turn-helix DNA-binding protein [Bacillus cereus group sp. Bc015]MDA2738421.1 sigma factor-like helix-turn-helix DNA-binding protein [Bacillus cereus group sp. Bc015]
MTNKYEQAYKLETESGVTAFLNDYPKLAEARFYANDFSISDFLLDFHFAVNNALTERQRQVIELTYYKDMRQVDVARHLSLSQQTVQEHTVKAIKNIATYHMLLKERGE